MKIFIEKFELNIFFLNKDKHPQKFSPKYMLARNTYREMITSMNGIDMNQAFSLPPKNTEIEMQQIKLWKKLIKLVHSNPLKFEDKLQENHQKQILYYYHLALVYLIHYPSMWIEAIQFANTISNTKITHALHRRGIEMNPECEILYFSYIELLESEKETEKAIGIFEKLLKSSPKSPLGLIQFIKFLRRTKGVEYARRCFVKYNQTPHCTFHVYSAMANLEYSINHEVEFAKNIYEQGMNKFSNEPDFILDYISFLEHHYNPRQIRSVFQNALKVLSRDRSLLIWKKFFLFENQFGNLKSIRNLERKFSSSFPDVDPSSLPLLIQRYHIMGSSPIAQDFLNVYMDSIDSLEIGKKLTLCNGFEDFGNLFLQEFNFLFASPKDDIFSLREKKPHIVKKEKQPHLQIPDSLSNFLSKLPEPQLIQIPAPDPDVLILTITQSDYTLPQNAKEKWNTMNQLIKQRLSLISPKNLIYK
eukprot:Anaeramoba_ignava/c20849_g2_i1.p1 GENE.c20849_g2_i1~~c20849_g2_i1.p1  ORF type:complete len:474 (-),score=137.17 c20849_g2_i1:49-1470(-)